MMRSILATTLVAAALVAGAPSAHAFGLRGGMGMHGGGPGGPGGPAGLPLRLLAADLTPAQRAQIRQILIANRADLRATLQELHAAHEALGDRLFAAGALTQQDLASETARVAAAHQKLLDNGTKVMLQVRAVLTPDQLAKAATKKKQLAALHDQIRALMGGGPGEDDAPPEDAAQ
jgi:Spy/CpxP family protein refolding chaperone